MIKKTFINREKHNLSQRHGYLIIALSFFLFNEYIMYMERAETNKLTRLPLDKMAAILANAFSCKIYSYGSS